MGSSKMSQSQEKLYRKLRKKQRKIFDSVMDNFPKTNFTAAYDIAIVGGIKFQFICK